MYNSETLENTIIKSKGNFDQTSISLIDQLIK